MPSPQKNFLFSAPIPHFSKSCDHSKENAPHSVDPEIGKQMDDPRGIDRVRAVVKAVKEQADQKESRDQQNKNQRRKPVRQNGDMIERKRKRGEKIGKEAFTLSAQRAEGESAEEELLAEGIDEGNIERDIEKVVLRDSLPLRERLRDSRKIHDIPKEKISPHDYAIDADADKKGRQKSPLFRLEEGLHALIARENHVTDGNPYKQCKFYARFRKIRQIPHAVRQRRQNAAAQHDQNDRQSSFLDLHDFPRVSIGRKLRRSSIILLFSFSGKEIPLDFVFPH